MQKILLALNSYDLNLASVHFASYIANRTKSKVTGLFFQENIINTVEASGPSLSATTETADPGSDWITAPLINENVNLFKNTCLANDVRYSVHHVKGQPLNEIMRESMFADLIITDGSISFSTEKDGWPSGFVKELLAHAKCPVIISPLSFDGINEIVFAYDGTESSIFAIKQFTYLFPQFAETKITLLEVLSLQDQDITEKERLQEWLMTHYDAVHLEILHGNPETELFKNFLAQKNKLAVMGAYGRTILFGHSTADLLLKTADIAVFITHR